MPACSHYQPTEEAMNRYKKDMKLTQSQQNDIDFCLYFMPKPCKNIPIWDENKVMYFEWSERGMHKDKIKLSHFTDGFNALVTAKQWRGRMMQIWEDGVLEGSVPYVTLLEDIQTDRRWWQFWRPSQTCVPRCVVDFMKKEMFRGIDAQTIEYIYQKIRSIKKTPKTSDGQ